MVVSNDENGFLEINKNKDHFGWYCETVIIHTSTSETALFSLYDVVTNEVAIRSGKGKLS